MSEQSTASKKVFKSESSTDSNLLQIKEARVGIIVRKLGLSHYGRMLDGACEYLISNGHSPILQPSYGSPHGEAKALNTLLSAGCEGIIFHCETFSDAKLKQLMSQHAEVILVSRIIEGFENRCVYLDNTLGGQIAARHLLDNGHTNVAMITGPDSECKEVQFRTDSFVQEFNLQGHAVSPELIFKSDFTFDGGMSNFRKMLSTQLPFTAVFAQNDKMAMGVLEVCQQKGLRVPEDLSVIGYDDHEQFRKFSNSGLTTIRQPNEEIGKRTAEMVTELITDARVAVARPPRCGRVTPELLVRDTVSLLIKPDLKKDEELGKDLTNREIECLHWMAAGKTSGEIGIILSISESTVNFHLKNTLIKLNSNNRVQAVAKAVHCNVISP